MTNIDIDQLTTVTGGVATARTHVRVATPQVLFDKHPGADASFLRRMQRAIATPHDDGVAG
jgi:hypothetical protein